MSWEVVILPSETLDKVVFLYECEDWPMRHGRGSGNKEYLIDYTGVNCCLEGSNKRSSE